MKIFVIIKPTEATATAISAILIVELCDQIDGSVFDKDIDTLIKMEIKENVYVTTTTTDATKHDFIDSKTIMKTTYKDM